MNALKIALPLALTLAVSACHLLPTHKQTVDIEEIDEPTPVAVQPTSKPVPTATQTAQANLTLNRKWELKSGTHPNLASFFDAKKATPITLDLTTVGKGNAYAGCNQFNFALQTTPVSATQGYFAVGSLMSTRMACDNAAASERLIATMLPAMKIYALQDNFLLLVNEDKTQRLVFVAK